MATKFNRYSHIITGLEDLDARMFSLNSLIGRKLTNAKIFSRIRKDS